MRNKKEFRDGVLERYNREKRRRAVRRKNMTSAVCSLCMVFVILLTGSAYLSAAFGAALFADVDASFGLIFDGIGNKEEAPTPPSDMEAPEEKPDQTKAESFDSEPEGDCAVGSEALPESGSVDEDLHGGRTTTAVTTPAAPDPIETAPETVGTARPRPETTRSPETIRSPETTRSPEWTMAPETTRAPEWTMTPETEKPANTTNPPAIETIKPAETTRKPTVTTKAPAWTKAPETTKTPQCTVDPDTNRVDVEENLSPSGDRSDETEPPKCESDGAGFWRFLILGSAGVCLAAACVFVYKALKKEK